MKIRTMVLTVALSIATAVFCFGQTPETEPTPEEATAEETMTPDAQKKEADAMTTASPAAKPDAQKKEAAAPAAGKKAADAKMAPAAKMAAAPMSPQMGTWKLNEAKSKLAPGMGKNTTVVYSAAKDMTKVAVEGVDKDGRPTKGAWVGKFDGKVYKAKGNLAWDSAMYKMVNDRTNEITTMKAGKVVWTGKIVVAKDGKSRVVTVNGTDAAGKKFKSKAVYDKM